MKIPNGEYVNSDWIAGVYYLAAKISMESSVFVNIGIEWAEPLSRNVSNGPQMTRIYFIVDGHEFETVSDLKKAITNKAFL